ncbi:terpenoid synthase [Crucibulum laeve]|uniref:Terpene synthase n=1 Tax=Crucibulum laeve TaxID=68775 RepID=A0A5C3LVZ6_9AGAR|nr:terpenoid synthase [Crucibulum laeve]
MDTFNPATQYKIPDLLCNWPWPRKLSSHYQEAKAESTAWVESLHPFDADGQRTFNACDLNLLASLTYSGRDKDFIRVGCDLMNFYFVYDEYTDVADREEAAQLAAMVIEAYKNPTTQPRPDGDVVGEMTRQFWDRALALTHPGSPFIKRFIETSEEFLHAVTQEAEDRINKRYRKVEDYLKLRRNTSGGKPTLALTELGLNIPEEVITHPIISELTQDAADIIVLVNDMHSYVRERACGAENHNVIGAIMYEHNLVLQEALGWLEAYAKNVIARFLANVERVPSWGTEIDDSVKVYINGLGQWVRGNDDWSYEAKRYYGGDGMKVKESRIVTFLPPKKGFLKEEQLREALRRCSSTAMCHGL